jgi:dihydrofolate synthase/folylpolyglutamate synthase
MPTKARHSGSRTRRTGRKRSGSGGARGGGTRRSGRSRTPAAGANITTYPSALRWLNDHADYERMRIVRYNSATFHLERMRRLLRKLGNPQQKLQCVHIAGTKGKGSTCAMLESMLRACGYTTGLYSSPHLVDLRERITINGQLIGQTDFVSIMKSVQYWVRRMTDKPTFFEIMTAVAIKYFAEQAVDVAIFETGLGGRLDATNVLKPIACGITQISLDHTEVLGRDLATIAREKGGIFKRGTPAISVEQPPEAAAALRQVAEQTGTPLQFTGEDIEFSYRFEANRELGPHTRVCLTTEGNHYEHLAVPLRGEHQALNCGLALALLDRLRSAGFTVPEAKVIEGLANTVLPGRMELAWEEPRILLDGAHNAASMAALIKAIGAHIPYDSLVMIFGCAADKEMGKMLDEVDLGADKVIFTRAKSNPRAADPKDLQKLFLEQSDKMAQTADTLDEALNLAALAVSREDLICVTGSFYLVGEAKKHLGDLASKRAKAAENN